MARGAVADVSASVLTTLAGALLVGSGCGQSKPSPVQRARALIEGEAEKIWRVAHPTVLKYEALAFDGSEQTAKGHKLKFTFAWDKKDAEPKHRMTLAFQFNAEGSLADQDVEDVIQIVSDDSLVKPFLVANVGSAPLREELKKLIDALPPGADDELKRLVDQKLSARGLVALWLKYRERHPAR
ncbi:MAG: hypothetical protein L0216_06515 [Planctomycetales bacterium]|nr:hypothetical protein [Planctomycetales bacterium]